jgi:hypothetical protein
VHLDIWGLVALAGTAVGASIETPSTPDVGIVVLAAILQGIQGLGHNRGVVTHELAEGLAILSD